MIERVKEGGSVILTTHTMEEADLRCTQIGTNMCIWAQNLCYVERCLWLCLNISFFLSLFPFLSLLSLSLLLCFRLSFILSFSLFLSSLFCLSVSLFLFQGIMNYGRLRCLGSPLHLKAKFGWGYQLQFHCSPGCVQEVERYVHTNLQFATHVETYAGMPHPLSFG